MEFKISVFTGRLESHEIRAFRYSATSGLFSKLKINSASSFVSNEMKLHVLSSKIGFPLCGSISRKFRFLYKPEMAILYSLKEYSPTEKNGEAAFVFVDDAFALFKVNRMSQKIFPYRWVF
ncbi:hypothetical protein SAMN05720469_11112 [Fibrobacter intestinalis]|uniref:Uncharacterized protein n=1 Tax=Fibrobacter intestinalis TaxID=28122 RepID=A0A1M6TSU0_9BACT|nr:hypothetical protein SAMN05720469_11112 [Fibrobacter intestinalis]